MMGPYMEILEALAELDRLTGRAPPDLQRGRLDEIEPDEMEPAAADEMGVQGAGSAVQVAGSAGTGRTHRGYRAQGLQVQGAGSAGTGRTHRGYRAQGLRYRAQGLQVQFALIGGTGRRVCRYRAQGLQCDVTRL